MTMIDRKKWGFSGISVFLRKLKHVLKGDNVSVKKIPGISGDYDYLEICHNGSVDYGKIIYVIKENCDHDGFCATLRFILCYLIFAEQHGLVPKIVLSEDFVYYDEEKSKDISNPWEYYFLQAEDSYDETNAKNVCYGNYYQMQMIRERYDMSAYKAENYYNGEILGICSPLVKKYFVLRPEIISDAEEMLRKVREKGGKILGIHFRGTDYKYGYNGHPVYIDEAQMIAEIKMAIESEEFSVLFLATDDASICDKIESCFREKEVLLFRDVYRSVGDRSVAFCESERKYHHYLLGYEIARDMYTLSLCDGLLAGKSSVGFISNLYKHSRNEEYEFMHIIDNGNQVSDRQFLARP